MSTQAATEKPVILTGHIDVEPSNFVLTIPRAKYDSLLKEAPAILSIDEAPFIIDSEASMEKALQKIRRANMGRRSE